MITKTKTTLQFILAATLLVSFAVTSCNDAANKEAAKDSATEVKPMEAAPVAPVADTTKKKDTASTRPVIPGN